MQPAVSGRDSQSAPPRFRTRRRPKRYLGGPGPHTSASGPRKGGLPVHGLGRKMLLYKFEAATPWRVALTKSKSHVRTFILQNIRLSSDLTKPLSRSRNSWADGD